MASQHLKQISTIYYRILVDLGFLQREMVTLCTRGAGHTRASRTGRPTGTARQHGVRPDRRQEPRPGADQGSRDLRRDPGADTVAQHCGRLERARAAPTRTMAGRREAVGLVLERRSHLGATLVRLAARLAPVCPGRQRTEMAPRRPWGSAGGRGWPEKWGICDYCHRAGLGDRRGLNRRRSPRADASQGVFSRSADRPP